MFSTAISQLRAVSSYLSFLYKLPHDIVLKLIDGIQSNSIDHFSDVSNFVALQIKIGQDKTLT